MKFKEAASLFVVTLLAVVLCAPCATAAATLDLQSDYLNKVLTLRRFYTGDHLSFAGDGTLIGFGETGPWTLDGQILVQGIELRGQSLEIQGRRLSLVFDKKDKPARDVISLMDESIVNIDERKKAEENFLQRTVEIEIALSSGETQDTEIKSAIDAVFVKPDESMADLVPDCWREYFEAHGRPRNHSSTHDSDSISSDARGGIAAAPGVHARAGILGRCAPGKVSGHGHSVASRRYIR